ncbi:MAG: serine acetyltransferase [Treponemataceae bacterium]|nr:serine acetyltransferase [Treponemataceae bacterium]
MSDNLEQVESRAIREILSHYKKENFFINKANDEVELDVILIQSLIEKFFRIIFPGFFRERDFKVSDQEIYISVLCREVMLILNKQIFLALKKLPENSAPHDENNFNEKKLQEKARAITHEFFGRIPRVREFLETDLQAAFDGDPAAFDKTEIILSYPGFYAITVNRLAHEIFVLGVPLIPRILTEFAHSRTGIDIHPGATIGKYFFIDHGTGIVIGETTVIGEHVKIYQGVTLGAISTNGGQKLKGVKRHPTIEDNVTIYSGASILGGDTVIGKNCVIGGNTFITKSVAPQTTVSIKK